MITYGKLGTIPFSFRFRYNYRLRPGLRVQYREHLFHSGRYGEGPWHDGIVTKTEPVVFVDKI